LHSLKRFIPARDIAANSGHSPVTSGFGNAGFDDLLAAEIAEVSVGPDQHDGGDGLAAREPRNQFFS